MEKTYYSARFSVALVQKVKTQSRGETVLPLSCTVRCLFKNMKGVLKSNIMDLAGLGKKKEVKQLLDLKNGNLELIDNTW